MCWVRVPRHKADYPWGAFLETHDVPQGNTVYIPYGEGGPDVVAAAHDGGTTMSLNGVHDGGVTAPAPAPTTVLGAGPEVYNNFSASQNCVGGSETSCIPEHPPVGDPSKTGPDRHPIKPSVCEPTHDGHVCVQPTPTKGTNAQSHPHTGLDVPLPAPASWYATTTDHATMVPAKEIAIVGQPALAAKGGARTAHASPGHLVMACHAFALAGIQGLVKGDFATFKQDAADNAAAATPVGGYVVTKIIA